MADTARKRKHIRVSDDADEPPRTITTTRKSARLAEKDEKAFVVSDSDSDASDREYVPPALDGIREITTRKASRTPGMRYSEAGEMEEGFGCTSYGISVIDELSPTVFPYECDEKADPFLRSDTTAIELLILEVAALPRVLIPLISGHLRQFTMMRIPVALNEFKSYGAFMLEPESVCCGKLVVGTVWESVEYKNTTNPSSCNLLVELSATNRSGYNPIWYKTVFCVNDVKATGGVLENTAFPNYTWFPHLSRLLYKGSIYTNGITEVTHSKDSLGIYHTNRRKTHPKDYISFGVHKWKPWDEIPCNYLVWLSGLTPGDDDGPALKWVEKNHPEAITKAQSMVKGRVCVSCERIFRQHPKPASRRVMCKDCDEDYGGVSDAENSSAEEDDSE